RYYGSTTIVQVFVALDPIQMGGFIEIPSDNYAMSVCFLLSIHNYITDSFITFALAVGNKDLLHIGNRLFHFIPSHTIISSREIAGIIGIVQVHRIEN